MNDTCPRCGSPMPESCGPEDGCPKCEPETACKDVNACIADAAMADVARLERELEEARRERDHWQDTAEAHCRNEFFWRGIIHEVGAMLGEEAYTSDDGSVQDEPLALKVADLVRERLAERDAARAELARERERADRYRKDFNTTQAALANAQDEVLRLRRARRDEER